MGGTPKGLFCKTELGDAELKNNDASDILRAPPDSEKI